jgi:hypothetical protein
MAKSARASSKKANHTKLRARVFGPVEQARAERIHAKLLETIQQAKHEKTEMDTAEDCELPHSTFHPSSTDFFFSIATTTTTKATKEDDFAKGSSLLTASIPRSLSDSTTNSLDPVQEDCKLRNLCFYLGLCSDIVGFTEQGDLSLAFDPLSSHC